MDEEASRPTSRLLIIMIFLLGVAVFMTSYGVGYYDLLVVMFFTYFLLSALLLRKGDTDEARPRGRGRYDDDWGFDMGNVTTDSKDDDWGFDFGDDDKEEYRSLIKTPPVERDPYSEYD